MNYPRPGMLLVNIANNLWSSCELKRNQSIFTELITSEDTFRTGIYVNPAVPYASRAVRYLPKCSLHVEPIHLTSGKMIKIFHLQSSVYGFRGPSVSRLLMQSIVAKVKAEIGSMPYGLWINSAEFPQVQLAESLLRGACWSVFDSSDDFTTMPRRNPQGFESRLRLLIARCSHNLCVTDSIATKLTHGRTKIFPNGTHFELLTGGGPTRQKSVPIKEQATVGFTGGLHSYRVDIDLLEYLVARFPSLEFVFAGYVDASLSHHRIWSLPNVRHIPPVPYKRLGDLIRTFDVAIVPHLDNEHTRGNDLLKVLEYFACGVPVVSTHCSNVSRYGQAVYLARTNEEFGNWIERLVSGQIAHDPEQGIAIAKSRSWKEMTPELLPWLENTR